VDEFNRGCEGHSVGVRPTGGLIGQKHQGGTKELPRKVEEVVVDFLESLEIRNDDPADLLKDLIQAATDGCLDQSQLFGSLAQEGGGFGHHLSEATVQGRLAFPEIPQPFRHILEVDIQ
jgi:hypothetical protein